MFFGGAEERAAEAEAQGFSEGIAENRRQFEQNRRDFAPFINRGNVAGENLLALIGGRGREAEQEAIDNFIESPGQAFLRERQERAVLRNASATGGLRGGNVLQELQRQAFGRASTRLDNRINALSGVASGGQNAVTNQANIGTQLASQVASLLAGRGEARGVWDSTASGCETFGSCQSGGSIYLMADLLRRIGQGVVSFGSGIPQSQIDTIRANREIAQNQATLGGQEIEANEQQAIRQQQVQGLIQAAMDPQNPRSDEALTQLFSIEPDLADKVFDGIGARSQSQREDAARRAAEISATPFEGRESVILRQIEDLRAQGRDPSDTEQLLGMAPEEQDAILRFTQAAALSASQRDGQTAQQRNFESLIRDAEGPEGDRRNAARVQLGLDPRAATSAQERIATNADLSGQVAESQGQIAGAKTQAEIDAELSRAEQVGAAEARKAALVESAVQGERIAANRVKNAEEALALLPEATAGAQDTIRLLNEIRNDPKLANVLGAVEGRIDVRVDEDESALLAKINQVTGQTFLQAYQTLKGGGPITDREGQAATEAQSRLTNRTVSLAAYRKAIDELIDITNARLQRLSQKAGGSQPTEQRVRTFNPETGSTGVMADQVVNVPGVGPVRFPDTMADEDIVTAIRQFTETGQGLSGPDVTDQQRRARITQLEEQRAGIKDPSFTKEVVGRSLTDLAGIPETVLQAGTGALAVTAGGVSAIPVTAIDAATGGDDPAGAGRSIIEEFQDKFTFQPRSTPGKRFSAAISAPFEGVERLADTIGEVTGDPDDVLGATAVKTALLGAPALLKLRSSSRKKTAENLSSAGRSAAEGTNQAIQKIVEQFKKQSEVPSVAELFKKGSAAFRRAAEAGVKIKQESAVPFAQNLAKELREEGIDPVLHPKSTRALQRILDDTEAGNLSFQQIETLRRIAKDAAASIERPDRRFWATNH